MRPARTSSDAISGLLETYSKWFSSDHQDYSFDWVSDFEIRNSKRLDQWKALWKYQLAQLNEIERIIDKATFRDGQEKQFSRYWYWSYERTTRIIFSRSGSHCWSVWNKYIFKTKVGCVFPMVISSDFNTGSIETTIRKTRPTLDFGWQILYENRIKL